MMKLLIIGASGFVGRNVVEAAAPLKGTIEITGTYNNAGDFEHFAGVNGCIPLKVELLKDDSDFSGYDAAIYLSGNADHGAAAQNPEMDLQLNTVAMLRFLKTFRGHLIYLSSGAVYYGLKGQVSVESSLSPTFTYGISKLASEHYANAARCNGTLGKLTIFRLFYAYGRHDKQRRLIPQVLRHIRSGCPDPFLLNGIGISETSPLDARDVAAALISAANLGVDGTYDLCGSEHFPLEEAVREIAAACGVQLVAKSNGIPETTPVIFRANSDSLWETLNIPRPRSLRTGVSQLNEWLNRPQSNG